MKQVQENLFQFKDHKFFKLFEEEEIVKQLAQEQEEVGNSIIDKAKENFNRFVKDAKGLVIKYKEFWDENETIKTNFDKNAKIYKMYDSNYVIGLMDIPDEALEPEKIDHELNLTEGVDETNEVDPLINKKQIPVEEHPEDEILDTPGQPKKCLVVYEMNKENRDEIFRTSLTSVMHAFEEFYENTFKGAMKAIITKAREKQEQIQKDIEIKSKEEEIKNKKSKVDKFLKQ